MFPLLDILQPDTAIRLQVRSTERHDDWRRRIGRWFQRILQNDPRSDAPRDPNARRRVQLLGVILLVCIWAIAVALIAATA
jgi:hypothetical protein